MNRRLWLTLTLFTHACATSINPEFDRCAETCNGCCTVNAQCRPGDSDLECGASGGVCVDCGGGSCALSSRSTTTGFHCEQYRDP